jgi:hypothetical protein
LLLSKETIVEPSPICEDKNYIDEIPFIVCSAMSNFGPNKKYLATHPIEEESEKDKSIGAELNHVNEETHSLSVAPCEPIALVLNLSTTPTSLEKSLVEPVAKFPLLQDDYKIVSCDKEKLCDHASLISTTQLVHGHDNSILDDTHAEVRRVHCINSEKEELKIISSLNCLCYIEFDFVCDLNSLENELFQKSGLLYFDYCSFHAIGLCDNNNKCIVKMLYICSNLKTSLMVSPSDQIMTCIQPNNTISSFPTIDHKLQVNFQEGESCLLPCVLEDVPELYLKEHGKTLYHSTNHNAKLRTVCSQQRENDEDITSSDMTILVTFDSKVKQLFIMSICNAFDELMVHHDVCSISFSEVLT